ncbi:MAG TPA: PTS fructose transporter subunit IIB, partial [Lachnoclostridium sp.]|nr:PTS fructose transporter subunit IIB [Lachnoclostridium sp.]
MKLVAITSCSTGIAHTYMAAEKLMMEAKVMGHEIKV